MDINKNTIICGSLALNAGEFGCKVHNYAFTFFGLNYIYKPFSINNIEQALNAVRYLNIKGVGITMPFKKTALFHVDKFNEIVNKTKVVNTIINNNGLLTAYNTDYLSVLRLCGNVDTDNYVIIGDGGMAQTCQVVLSDLGIKQIRHINRSNWTDINSLKHLTVINCTPVNIILDTSNRLIDCNINSSTGQELAIWQAAHQFNLYTGIDNIQNIVDIMRRAL